MPHPHPQLDERSEHVWQSAAGCTLQLLTHGGYWVRAAVAALPPCALSGLLRASLAHEWAPELHTRFAQLVPLVLARSGAGGDRDSNRLLGGGDSSLTASAASQRCAGLSDVSIQWQQCSVDAAQLTAFGGSRELLHHFSRAGSVVGARCLLLPLLELSMPAGTEPSAAAASAVTLAGTPARLRVLQAALWGARPRLADPLMTALSSAPGLDRAPEQLQLLFTLLLELEVLAVGGSCCATSRQGSASGVEGGTGGGNSEGSHAASDPANSSAGEASLRLARQLTCSQVRGSLAAADTALAAAAWRSLRELCWCSDPAARAASANWLQRLLDAALEASAEVRIAGLLAAHMHGRDALSGPSLRTVSTVWAAFRRAVCG